MDNQIKSRIVNLEAAIERRRMEQEAPVDPLSLSLTELQEWLAGLDEQGRAELLDELNSPSENGTMGLDLMLWDLKQMIESYQF